jgi:hypothetical protein
VENYLIGGGGKCNFDGEKLIEIDKIVYWTSPVKKILHKHNKSLTLFCESGFINDDFPLDACDMITTNCYEEHPSWLPVIELDYYDLDSDVKSHYDDIIERKINSHFAMKGYKHSESTDKLKRQIIETMFSTKIGERKEKLNSLSNGN